MKSRLHTLRGKMASDSLDALYVSNLINVRYLTGFTGSTAMLFVYPDAARIYVDPRYWVQADQQVSGAEVVKCGTGLAREAYEALRSAGPKRLGFEALHLTVAARDALAENLPGVELAPTVGLIEAMRLVKDAGEIEAIRKACALVDELFAWIQPRLRPGTREVDIALDLEHEMRRRGAEAVGFATILASGENGAKPHAGVSEKPLAAGEFVTMDFGARLDGYNADITRTVAIGEVSEKHREVYDVVLRAQGAAVEAMRPGAGYVEVDAVARDIITEAGYGEYFGHGLGHSLGLEVHDGARLSPAAPEGAVRPGEVWTIEPGIYIPGWGGVRIEDDVLVTDGAPRVLTRATRELLILPA